MSDEPSPTETGAGSGQCGDSAASAGQSDLAGLTAALGLEPARPGHDPLLGCDIGGVTIVRLIAEGGMGRVYEGKQEKPGRTVAVKVMRPGLTSPSLLKRFEYEAEVLGRLQHPGIAHIYSVGVHQVGAATVPYFVMEYIPDAKSLTAYAEEFKLPTRQRLDLFRSVCDAVAHGHQKGVIHRDLKPSNILVDASGQPKVIDFGVARATDSDMALTTMQTDVGQLIGTLQYMSPEQLDADPHDIDIRSDVYALGVVLYELLARKPPYDVKKKAVYEVMRIVKEEEPTPLSTLDATVHSDLSAIAGKCLIKEKQARYLSASDLAEDIQRYLKGDPVKAAVFDRTSLHGNEIPESALVNLLRHATQDPSVAGLIEEALSKVGRLTQSTAEILVRYQEVLPTSQLQLDGVKAIEPEAVKTLATVRRVLSLNGLAALTTEVAEALSIHRGELVLNGLTSISTSVARSLAFVRSNLTLNGLTSLPDGVIEELADHKSRLRLDGLIGLTREDAAVLANHKGDLCLGGLTTLSPDVAEELARHKHSLMLCGLTSITTEVAEVLAMHVGDLWLDGLVTLSLETAKALAKHKGCLHLDGLTTLSPETAAAFSHRESTRPGFGLSKSLMEDLGSLDAACRDLWLNGLTTLSPSVAEALAPIPGVLSLCGLRLLSHETAEALAKHRGNLFLAGLTTLSSEVADALAYYTGPCLSLQGLFTLSPDAASRLAKRRGGPFNRFLIPVKLASELERHGVMIKWQRYQQGNGMPERVLAELPSKTSEPLSPREDISEVSYESLAQCDDRELRSVALRIRAVNPSSAAILAASGGNVFTAEGIGLALPCLQDLSPECAEALISFRGPLQLNSLKTLSPEAARALATHKGSLSLDGLEDLSLSVATALARHEGKLSLGGLTTLSREVAKALARRSSSHSLYAIFARDLLHMLTGELVLNGLTRLSPEIAKELAKAYRDLRLDGVTSLTPEAAEMLARHTGDLKLSRLAFLSPPVAAALAKHKGELSLSGLTTLTVEVASALAKRRGRLSLPGVSTLVPPVAAALAKHKGELSLSGLTTLTVEVASALAKHRGRLSLPSITRLLPQVAEALAKHKGEVWLLGLNALPLEVADAFAKRVSKLVLDSGIAMSMEAMMSLTRFRTDAYVHSRSEPYGVNRIVR